MAEVLQEVQLVALPLNVRQGSMLRLMRKLASLRLKDGQPSVRRRLLMAKPIELADEV